MGDCMKGGKHSKLKEKKAGKFPSLFSLVWSIWAQTVIKSSHRNITQLLFFFKGQDNYDLHSLISKLLSYRYGIPKMPNYMHEKQGIRAK